MTLAHGDVPLCVSERVNLNNGKAQAVAELLLPFVGRNKRVLDFGCGGADKSAIAAALGFETYASDLFEYQWHRTALPDIQDYCERHGVRLLCGDFFELCDGMGFDLVLVLDVIEHFPNPPLGLLERLAGHLNPGGAMIITVPSAVNLRKRLDVLRGRTNYPSISRHLEMGDAFDGHYREYTRGDLAELAQRLPFDEYSTRGLSMMLDKVPPKLWGLYQALTCVVPYARDSIALILEKRR